MALVKKAPKVAFGRSHGTRDSNMKQRVPIFVSEN
jgi:hypothetical protein